MKTGEFNTKFCEVANPDLNYATGFDEDTDMFFVHVFYGDIKDGVPYNPEDYVMVMQYEAITQEGLFELYDKVIEYLK